MIIRIAFIGIGGFAAVPIRALLARKRNDISIVGAVDPYSEASPIFQTIKGLCPIYENEELLYQRARPHLVVISTPIGFHAEQIRRAVSHRVSVLCEKPLTGDIADLPELLSAERKAPFVSVGYQWSYSSTIQTLKTDIINGKFGRPIRMKTIILWPRNKKYFNRSTGWAGKRFDKDGRKISDSVVNNATAHYLHNMLYLLGDKRHTAARAEKVRAILLRVNDIETFDTVTACFRVKGARALFIASHAVKKTVDPTFEYAFEKGKVIYPDKEGGIRAIFENEEITYGNPFAEGADHKIIYCIERLKEGRLPNLCGVAAASEQVKFIDALEKFPVTSVTDFAKEENEYVYVDGLDDLLEECYQKFSLLEWTRLKRLSGSSL